MSLTITPETKHSFPITNESKSTNITWDQAIFTWNAADGTWDVTGLSITKETKKAISITNENKN